MYDVDPNAIEIDYSVIKKFAILGVAPPVSQDGVAKSEKALIELRDTMKMRGKMDQAEGKARFLKDNTFIETDDYKEIKEKMDGVSKELLATLNRIRKEHESHQRDADDGVEIDELDDMDEEQVDARFTRLRP